MGIVHKEIAFPVVYLLLDNRGNSSADERIDLMQGFLFYSVSAKLPF
ncbi:MAG: hypothetical protein NW224_06675 [Leptolyngbyaceae cyanobacterium bins.302]|nr:hypothetical protein [Leptolyngbyaceae cyanobacterium bins.302]